MKKIRLMLAALVAVLLFSMTGCGSGSSGGSAGSWASMKKTGSMDLKYASQFSVDYYEGGYALINIVGDGKFLMVPEGAKAPDGLDEDITVIKQPFDQTYLAASSAMDFFRQLDSLDTVRMTSTKAADWSFPEVQEAIEKGDMLYIGKYSAPDYEVIVDENCNLCIESTMIYHSPDIKEMLEEMGVPVMVERSSYETDPLGRMEWIKLYGLLTGKDKEAEEFFDGKTKELAEVLKGDKTDKKVAFFYISSAGYVNVRKPGDYISKMIDMAGGKYALANLELEEDEENALSTMNMQMEDFFANAQDADILIYNSTIEGPIETYDQLFDKNKLLKEFKAVKEGNVWCTGNNMFQETTGAADMITELYAVIHDKADDNLKYMTKVK